VLFLLLAVAFVVPLLDVRRPARMVHLDLLVLAFAPLYYVRRMDQASPSLRSAVLLTTAGLVYLFARLSLLAFRPARPYRPLVASVPVPLVGLCAATLLGLQLLFPLYDYRPVIDVGTSSVAGAHHLIDGVDVYGAEEYAHPELHPDTYGPVVYLAYVPFAYALSDDRAARAAAGVFHVLTAVALLLLGRRLEAGARGTRLGVTYAYAWCAYPPAVFVTIHAYNDMLVALCVVGAMLAASPLGRGFVLGLGAAAKFVPAVLLPVFARPVGEHPRRGLLLYAISFAVTVVALTALVLPDGGVAELYRRTLGWQLHRTSESSIWGQFPALDWLQQLARVLAAVVVLAAAAFPRRRTPLQVAAAAGAVVVACELTLTHLLPSYVVWFAPLALIAVLGPPSGRESS
jgi:Glycosyltransferase family 87